MKDYMPRMRRDSIRSLGQLWRELKLRVSTSGSPERKGGQETLCWLKTHNGVLLMR